VTARRPTLSSALRSWWRGQRQSASFRTTARNLIAIGSEFLRDSLPNRQRQRFGDMDFDWECRVNTTSANVSWRARLIGLLNSPYQPIEPPLFREIMDSLAIDFSQFIFIDIGSGKGRALLLAWQYPFRRIVGIELLPELNLIAQDNIRRFSNQGLCRVAIEAIRGDATKFAFPNEPLVVLLNNPLPENGLRTLIRNLEESLGKNARPVFVIYANPVLEQVLADSKSWRKIAGTHQYSVFNN
jgi:SAM-dependent methyltransferase